MPSMLNARFYVTSYLRALLLLCACCCVISTARAQSENYVTLIIQSNDSSAFDFEKIQNKASQILAKEDLSVRTVHHKNGRETIDLNRFSFGETAKVTAKISAGTVIKGAHFSSFPVSVEISARSENNRDRIEPKISNARAQHTNSIEGLTSAINKALDKGLGNIAKEIAAYEPLGTTKDNLANSSTLPPPGALTQTDSKPKLALAASQGNPTNPALTPEQLNSIQCNKSKKSSTLLVLPSSVVKKGEALNIVTCYRTNTGNDQQVRIKTTLESKIDYRKVLLNSEDFVLSEGYWKSAFNFPVTSSITPGAYTLAQAIYRQGKVEYLKTDLIIQ